MSEINKMPKGWAIIKLVEGCDEILAGGDVPKNNYSLNITEEFQIPIFANGEKNKGLYGYTNIPKITSPSVTISARGSIGFSEYRNKPFFPIVRLIVLCPNRNLDAQFLKYAVDNCKITNTGTTIPQLTVPTVKELQIPLPPLPEQHRIVSKIEELFSSLDKGVESLKTARQQLKVYRQAVLKWAFEGRLTNENVVDGELPVGWKPKKLADIVDKIADGPFGSNLKSTDYTDEGVRVIRLENIGNLEFKNEYKSFVTSEKYETIKKHTVSGGDIIFSSFISESIRTAILPDYIGQAINKADCFLVRTSESKVNKKYLVYYFSTKGMYNQLVGEIHGATRPRINTSQLKVTQIPFAPLAKQQAIVSEIESRLSVCDKMEESITQSLLQAEALRQSILKKAFEGKLVPQNPADEPASVLLERIKSEREKNVVRKVAVKKQKNSKAWERR